MRKTKSINAITLESVHTNDLVKDKIKNIGANSIFSFCYLQNASNKARK